MQAKLIRDPSDGSVRVPRKPEESGLPPVQDPGSIKEAERLQRSRAWMKAETQEEKDRVWNLTNSE